jgi:uracil DNA glycosylase
MANNSHYFHAEAHALSGSLIRPFQQEIKKQAFVKLEGNLMDLPLKQRAEHSYFSQHAKNFRLESIVSYASADTQVSGHDSQKSPGASVTLATSVVEDLNVLNVVTADRVVAQVSTTHFPGESSPRVTFLGTHFENLRIARHGAEPYLNHDLIGDKPRGESFYLQKGSRFMKAVEEQYKRLKAQLEGLSADDQQSLTPENPQGSLAVEYRGFGDFEYDDNGKLKPAAQSKSSWNGITCSLVENVEIKDIKAKSADGKAVEISAPATSFGHVIHIPDFGTVFLAELKVNHNSFNLTMIRLEMGCLADGAISLSTANVNGGGGGTGGGGKTGP